MDNKIIIFNKEIEIKEYNSERVITAYDIAELHGRDVKVINQQFNNNRNKFIENEDYFVANRNLIHKLKSLTLENNLQNLKEIILFTDTGYLLLTKTFNDELSWKIQRELVKAYFKLKELKDRVESGELEIRNTNENMLLEDKIQLEKMKSIENIMTLYKNSESKPEKLMIIEMVAQMTGNKNKFGYGMVEGATTELIKGTATAQEIAEKMRNSYKLNENFTQGSVNSLAKFNNLTDERYRYLFYNENIMSNSFRYYVDEIIPKLYDIIMDKKKKRYLKYGLEKPYHELFPIEIDEEF